LCYLTLELGDEMGKVIIPKRKWRFPDPWRREYERYILRFTGSLWEAVENSLPQMELLLENNPLRADGIFEDVYSLMRSLTINGYMKFEEADIYNETNRIAKGISDYNLQEFKAVMRSAFRIDLFVAEPYLNDLMKLWITENVARIKSIPDQYFKEVENIVRESVMNGSTLTTLSKALESRFKVSQDRARLIARDQTGKVNYYLTRQRQLQVGIRRYQWLTAGDERVRDLHEARANKLFRWDNPPEGGHPGQAVQCRCIAQPVVDLDKVSFMGAM